LRTENARSTAIPRFSPPRHLTMGENLGNTALAACIVFLETKDKANNDSSAAWAKKVEILGGKVANKLTDKVTHVVFKGGKKTVPPHCGHHLPRSVGCAHRCLSPRPSGLAWPHAFLLSRGRPGTRPPPRAFPWSAQCGWVPRKPKRSVPRPPTIPQSCRNRATCHRRQWSPCRCVTRSRPSRARRCALSLTALPRRSVPFSAQASSTLDSSTQASSHAPSPHRPPSS